MCRPSTVFVFFFFFWRDSQTITVRAFAAYWIEGRSLAVYQASPADLSWLISLSVSLGNLLITNQKASLTLHMRSGTGADRCRRVGGRARGRRGRSQDQQRRPVSKEWERPEPGSQSGRSTVWWSVGRGRSWSERYAKCRGLCAGRETEKKRASCEWGVRLRGTAHDIQDKRRD